METAIIVGVPMLLVFMYFAFWNTDVESSYIIKKIKGVIDD